MKTFNNFGDAVKWIGKIPAKASKQAIETIAEQVYKDSEKYTYEDTKTMYRSGALYSRFSEGLVILRTPYAKLRYYKGGTAGSGNRRAVPQWFESTKKENINTYKKQYAEAINKAKGE